MTTRWLALLLVATGLLAEEALRSYTDDEIRRHLDAFDGSVENRQIPEAEVADTASDLQAAFLYLKALGRLTERQVGFQQEILDRIVKGLTAKKRPIVNIHCARLLGEMGDPKGAAPLLAWVQVLLKEPHPNPTAVEYGFRSLAWIGPTDGPARDLVLGCATGEHGDAEVIAAAMRACAEWRELDGETRKEFFDRICTFVEVQAAARDGRKERHALVKEGLEALRKLAVLDARFASPAHAREWFRTRTTWETYKGRR